jgi:hypothetical protein
VQTLKNAGEADRMDCKQQIAQQLYEQEGLDLGLCKETLDLLAAALFGENQREAANGQQSFITSTQQSTPPNAPNSTEINPGNFRLRKQPDGRSLMIIEYNGTEKEIVIPKQMQGVKVTAIGDAAFNGKGLTSVIVPDSVTHIGDLAFANNLLTSIIIPDRITCIGNHSFHGNTLTSVIIPDRVTHIGNYAFTNNLLTSVIIPNSITHIGDYAFHRNRLTSVDIPDSVVAIGISAFTGNQIAIVSVPSRASVGQMAFGDAAVIRR